MPRENYQWLIDNEFIPLYLEKDKILHIGIMDPSNEKLMEEVSKRIEPYEPVF